MLQVPFFTILLRGIPEGILAFYAVYIFSGEKIDWKRLIISGVILSITPYLIRLLPVAFGIHIIMGLVVMICLAIRINKINIIRAVTSCIIYIILLSLGEAITVPLIVKLAGLSTQAIKENQMQMIIVAFPSLIFVFLVTLCTQYIRKTIKKEHSAL